MQGERNAAKILTPREQTPGSVFLIARLDRKSLQPVDSQPGLGRNLFDYVMRGIKLQGYSFPSKRKKLQARSLRV